MLNGPLRGHSVCLLTPTAVGAFQLAYFREQYAYAVLVYLGCLFALAWAPSARWAFYAGLAIGMGVAAPQLWFFLDIFGPGAIGLWGVFAIWIAFAVLLSQIVVSRWPARGMWWVPVIWLALEYFRSELHPLRFAWLTPGFALVAPPWTALAGYGVYGFSFLALLGMCTIRSLTNGQWQAATISAACAALSLVPPAILQPQTETERRGMPLLVGVQLEGPTEEFVIDCLSRALTSYPQVDLLVLSEYTFDGPVPESVREWCRVNQKYLIAGGKELLPESPKFRNTAYVVSPEGEICFQQGKIIPVRFMNDGVPTGNQSVWDSPWGRIGIGLCFDLSFSRVIDRLIATGAQGLIIPTMEPEDWGSHEHWLHAKIAPVRASEYKVPIFRLASSGISQSITAGGEVQATAPYPKQMAMVAAEMDLTKTGRLPPDRWLAPAAVIALAGLLVFLGGSQLRANPMINHRPQRTGDDLAQ